MATWTPEKTWTFGAILPAAEMNTYVRDNVQYHQNILTKAQAALVQVLQGSDNGGNGIQSWNTAGTHYAELLDIGGVAYLTSDGTQYLTVDGSGNISFTGTTIKGIPWDPMQNLYLGNYSGGQTVGSGSNPGTDILWTLSGLVNGGIYFVHMIAPGISYVGGNSVGYQNRMTCNNGGTVLVNNPNWSGGNGVHSWLGEFCYLGAITGTTVELEWFHTGDGASQWHFSDSASDFAALRIG